MLSWVLRSSCAVSQRLLRCLFSATISEWGDRSEWSLPSSWDENDIDVVWRINCDRIFGLFQRNLSKTIFCNSRFSGKPWDSIDKKTQYHLTMAKIHSPHYYAEFSPPRFLPHFLVSLVCRLSRLFFDRCSCLLPWYPTADHLWKHLKFGSPHLALSRYEDLSHSACYAWAGTKCIPSLVD